MKTHDYNKIAAIVGEDKIDALREAGVDIADKPTKPTTGLFGRWAKHPTFGDVLVISQHPDELNMMSIAYLSDNWSGGAMDNHVELRELTFPEETTRPEDVPVGEAWIVTVDDGEETVEGITAFKMSDIIWVSGVNWETAEMWWENDEVVLISPLTPARPLDTGRGKSPETVTTEEEYEALPAGSIVAGSRRSPFRKTTDGRWVHGDDLVNVAGSPRYVLRYGWGGEND